MSAASPQKRYRTSVVLLTAMVLVVGAYFVTEFRARNVPLARDLSLPAASAWPILGRGAVRDTIGGLGEPAFVLLGDGHASNHRLCRLEGEGRRLGRARCVGFRTSSAYPFLLKGGKSPILGALEPDVDTPTLEPIQSQRERLFRMEGKKQIEIPASQADHLPRYLVRTKGGTVLSSERPLVGGDQIRAVIDGLGWSRQPDGKQPVSGTVRGVFAGSPSACATETGGAVAYWNRVPRPAFDSLEGGRGTREPLRRPPRPPSPTLGTTDPLTLAFLARGTWSHAVEAELPKERSHDFDLDCVGSQAIFSSAIEHQGSIELLELRCDTDGCESRRASFASRGEVRYLDMRVLGNRTALLWIAEGTIKLRLAAFEDLPKAREYSLFRTSRELAKTLPVQLAYAKNAIYLMFAETYRSPWHGVAIGSDGTVVAVTTEDEA